MLVGLSTTVKQDSTTTFHLHFLVTHISDQDGAERHDSRRSYKSKNYCAFSKLDTINLPHCSLKNCSDINRYIILQLYRGYPHRHGQVLRPTKPPTQCALRALYPDSKGRSASLNTRPTKCRD